MQGRTAGAVHIYAAQAFAARFTAPSLSAELLDFKSHDEGNRTVFWSELEARGLHRCRSYVLCGIGGLVLGVTSGLFGRQAMAATTVAVERVVLRHLQHQIAVLGDTDPGASAAIKAVIAEEQHHHDQAASHIPKTGLWLRILQPIVSASTELVIWLGMKL